MFKKDPKVVEAHCDTNDDCEAGMSIEVGNGVMTGNCVQSRIPSTKTCEILSWCPVEVDIPPL